MSTAQVVALRFSELVDNGYLDAIQGFISDDIVVSTWNGVIVGKAKAMTFFEDFRRYMHHTQNYNRWRQVQHCLDPNLEKFAVNAQQSSYEDDAMELSARYVSGRVRGGDIDTEQYFNAEGYDSQGYAMFERDGQYGCHPKFTFW
eukprot:CAMPEP_0176409524 /NCGR_PEP_ID=MMETSP0127-20121128/2546_1 /TAXON_ID=938130 /ORGANISM="Platyophrya macrostoma, Strain WH" /LENGTH=144 /DNA_ID=CAMNT_0017788913 /DNA_START=43 /DNA_END=474 /DNA_ORIENTATION=-